jgi:hypothetical protein
MQPRTPVIPLLPLQPGNRETHPYVVHDPPKAEDEGGRRPLTPAGWVSTLHIEVRTTPRAPPRLPS